MKPASRRAICICTIQIILHRCNSRNNDVKQIIQTKWSVWSWHPFHDCQHLFDKISHNLWYDMHVYYVYPQIYKYCFLGRKKRMNIWMFHEHFVMVHCAASLCLTSRVFTLCFDSLSKYLFVLSSGVPMFWHHIYLRLLSNFVRSYSFHSDFVLLRLLCLNNSSSYNSKILFFLFCFASFWQLDSYSLFLKVLVQWVIVCWIFIHLLAFES